MILLHDGMREAKAGDIGAAAAAIGDKTGIFQPRHSWTSVFLHSPDMHPASEKDMEVP